MIAKVLFLLVNDAVMMIAGSLVVLFGIQRRYPDLYEAFKIRVEEDRSNDES